METLPTKNISTSVLMTTFGIGRNALRLYESKGLLKSPKRSEAGYRKYDQDDVSDLKFILEAKKIGFTLVEISELLIMMRNEEMITCGTVSAEITTKTKEIDIQIKTLLAKKGFLNSFLKVCGSTPSNNPCDVKQSGFTPSSCCG
jgi:MerR family Zn(II)-responsive transcriptional regulator of zntA